MQKKISKIIFSLALTFWCSCAYRFTNKHISIPDGAKTIAIAPIFDSSRIVIPHDVIWQSLQDAFASSGHLTVTNTSRADFFLQAHVKDASSSEYDSDSITTLRDPSVFKDASGKPTTPGNYVNLHAADIYSKREKFSYTIFVEIWDLRNKKLLLKGEYPIATNFNMLTVPSPLESQYLRNEETVEFLHASLAKDFAKQLVTDLFSTPQFMKKY